MTDYKKEEKNQRIAWIVSVGLHALLLLAFIFMIAWREPNPPYPEYGIEVNFGMDNVGSGDIQPETPVADTENTEEAIPEESSTEEALEETEPIEESSESSEESSTSDNTEVITQPDESPTVVEEKVISTEQPVPVEVQKEEKKEETDNKKVEETPKEVKQPIVYKKNEGAEGKDGENNTPKDANHGDDANTVGDKGNEEGTLNTETLYGKKGGGDGAPALNITGWIWDEVPNKKDNTNENGFVRFKFTIDDRGEVFSVVPEQFTVSHAVMNFYKQQLQKITFSQTDLSIKPLPRTTGTVTFIIKSK